MSRSELAERQALEIRAPRLAGDVERVARVPLDAAEVAFPPADAREQREHLRPSVARRVGEAAVELGNFGARGLRCHADPFERGARLAIAALAGQPARAVGNAQ